MAPRPGDVAPAFALPDAAGKSVSSGGFKGKPSFVYFYPKDDTPGCTTEACQLDHNLSSFRSLGVPVVGISQNEAASHQAFRASYVLRSAPLSDPDRHVYDAYGAWAERPGRGEGVIRFQLSRGRERTREAGLVLREARRTRAGGPGRTRGLIPRTMSDEAGSGRL